MWQKWRKIIILLVGLLIAAQMTYVLKNRMKTMNCMSEPDGNCE